MTHAGQGKQVAAALRYLQRHDVLYQFDNKERVVVVSFCNETGADEAAHHIGNLPDLRTLQIESPSLTDAGLLCLKGLTKLRKLRLVSPNVTGDGLVCLAGMKRLEEMYLNLEQLRGSAFGYVALLRNVVDLSIEAGHFADDNLAPLSSLTKLERLSLTSNTKISGTFATHLTHAQLQELDPGEHVSDPGLVAIAKLTSLEKLCLKGTFSDHGLRQISALKRLTTLMIIGEVASSDGVGVVAHLPKLSYLRLNVSRLTDEVIPALARCTALDILGFCSSVLSDAGLQQLREALPRCDVRDDERDWPRRDPEPPLHDPARPRLDSQTPFQKLLAEADDYDLVHGTYEKIGRQYDYMIDGTRPVPETWIVLVWYSHDLLGWGGFERLFEEEIPGDPDFQKTAHSYRALGLDGEYEIFQEAFKLFPNGRVPPERKERCRLLEDANTSARSALDKQFDDRDRLRIRQIAAFIRQHAAEFAYLNDLP